MLKFNFGGYIQILHSKFNSVIPFLFYLMLENRINKAEYDIIKYRIEKS